MTTYNTGNPIGSTEVKDLYDNAQNFDTLANTTTLETVPDRLGVPRMTLHGFEQEAKRLLEASKFQPPIQYAPGIEVTTSSLTVDYMGVIYYALPSALPFTTGAWNPAQWSPLQNTYPGNELLVFDDYTSASAAAATLPDGQMVISQNSAGAPHKYKVIAGGLQDLGLIGASVFLDNESDFSTTKVAANQNTIFIYGKDAAHDGGHSVYKRVASEPVNAPKAQTEDGAWWERVADNDPIGLVLAVGSSTYEGFGAGDDGAFSPHGPPSKANGWTSHPDSVMGLLGAYVASKGGRLLNISIGGKNSSWFIDRFWEDIAPWNPRTVLFGTGWANEPGANAWQKARSYTRNLARLRGLCDKIGASLIVGAFNPVSNGNITTNRGQWEVKRWCATNGIRCWDFSASFPEGENGLPADLRVDDIHMNKAGCAVAYESIVKSDLEVERMHGPLSPFPESKTAIRAAYTGSEREAPVYFYVDNDDHCPRGWAVQLKFIADNVGANLCTVMTLDARDGTSARIRYFDKSIRFTTGASTDHFSIPFDPEDYQGSVRLFVSYDHRLDNVIVRINSASSVAGTASVSLPYLKRVRFLGNAAGSFGTAAGWEFISAIVWGASARADGHVTGLYDSDFPIHASMLAATAMDNVGNFGIPNSLKGLYSFAATDSGVRANSRLWDFDIYCSAGALTLSSDWLRLPLSLKTTSVSGVDVLRNNEIYLPEGRYSISVHVRANATTVPFTGGMRVYLKRPGVSSAVVSRSTCEVGVTGTHQNKMAAEFPMVIAAGGARLYVEVNAPTGAGSINQDDTNTFVRISRLTYESSV